MADIFKSMGNIKNGKVTKDGSVLDLEGNTISGPNEDLAIFYRTLAPTKNEVLNSDGSTSEIPSTPDYNDVINKPQINGNTLNSGNNTADSLGLQDKLTFDNVPTLNSDNVVKSGGVYAADLSERTARETAISLEKTERETADNTLSQRISAQEGLGGYLPMHDFGVETPTQQELTDYAMANISTATVPADIFNGTRVTNLFDNIVWVLTNTPNTSPALFEWEKAYNNTVNIASNFTLGIVQGSAAVGKVSVSNVDGTMSVNTGGKQFSEEDFTTSYKNKLNNIEASAEVNTIESILLNGSAIVPDSSRAVDIILDKETVNLNNVDNTSDINKPVSTAQQTAIDKKVNKLTSALGQRLLTYSTDILADGLVETNIDANNVALKTELTLKANQSSLTDHINNTNNPHIVTKAQVGLGNVDNTSDANKPVSTAQQTAIDNAILNAVNIASNSTLGIVQGSSGVYKVSVNNINGIMTVNRGNKQFSEEDFTASDKSKLDNIEPLAEVNTIENIRLNGSLLTPDSSKTVGITVDKDTVGLGNVDNTSDANKPVSTAQQTAIDNAILNVAKTNIANTFSAKQTLNGGIQAKNFQTTSYSTSLTGGFGIDTDTKPAFIGLTIIGSSFIFITKVEVGMQITLQLIQDSTGGGTVTWSSDFRFPAGVKPITSTAPNVKDIFTFICTEENTLDCVNAVFNLPV